MDWRSANFDWNQARAFLVTAEKGSFSAAASVLQLTQPTISRQIAAFEAELSIALFEKSGRGMTLTPAGHDLLAHARTMGEAAISLSLAASGKSTSLQGDVCISSSEITAAYLLPGLVMKINQDYPEIRIEIVASNDVSDLRRREADIAVRAFRPTQLDLIVKSIGIQHWGLYASPRYVENHGPLETHKELERANYIGFDSSNKLIDQFASQGIEITQQNVSVITENMLVGIELIKAGTGIGVVPIVVGENLPNIERIAGKLIEFEVENWLVSHRELRTNQRVRAVFDYLSRELHV